MDASEQHSCSPQSFDHEVTHDIETAINEEDEVPQEPITGTNVFLNDVNLVAYASENTVNQMTVNQYNHGLFLTLILSHLLNGAANRAYNFNPENSESFTSHITAILGLTQIITNRWNLTDFIRRFTANWHIENLCLNNLYQYSNAVAQYLSTHLENEYDDLRSTYYISSVLVLIDIPFVKNLPSDLLGVLNSSLNRPRQKGIFNSVGQFLNQLAIFSRNILIELPLNQEYFIGAGGDEALDICLDALKRGQSQNLQAVHEYIGIIQDRVTQAQERCRNMQEDDLNNDNDDDDPSDPFNWLTNCLPQIF